MKKKSKYADIRKIILDTSKRYEKKYKKIRSDSLFKYSCPI